MSYSLSIASTNLDNLSDELGKKIDALPDGPGKDEANEHVDLVSDIARRLVEASGVDEFACSVSGSVTRSTDTYNGGGSLSVSVWKAQPQGVDAAASTTTA